jgi:hypothetical protein
MTGSNLILDWSDNMVYVVTIVMLFIGYYTFTFGISLWRDDRNKLGGIGAWIMAVVGTLVPIAVLFIKK